MFYYKMSSSIFNPHLEYVGGGGGGGGAGCLPGRSRQDETGLGTAKSPR